LEFRKNEAEFLANVLRTSIIQLPSWKKYLDQQAGHTVAKREPKTAQ
jgi:hypothetical protein